MLLIFYKNIWAKLQAVLSWNKYYNFLSICDALLSNFTRSFHLQYIGANSASVNRWFKE